MGNTARTLVAASILAGTAWALSGCPDTQSATGYTPITGIVITSSALVAGFGCGLGQDEVYRYVAVVSRAVDGGTPAAAGCGPDGSASAGPHWSSVFDCFADGVFEQIPSSDSGSQVFSVQVYAFSLAAYQEAGLPTSPQCLGAVPSSCGVQDASAACAFGPQAPWVTTCSATQQQGIPVLAVCGPLEPAAAQTAAEAGGPPRGTEQDADIDAASSVASGSDAGDATTEP